MKPGDLVEFKAGLFGVAAPNNLGIYLERVKKKGNFFVVLHTVKGRQEMKADHITGRRFTGRRLEPPFEEAELKDRLKQFIKEMAAGGGDGKKKKDKPDLAPGEINDRVVWNKVWEGGTQSPEQMAERYFQTTGASRSQVGQIRNVLTLCARPGVGYFEREPGRGERWTPLTLEAYKAVTRDVEGLNKLRKRLIDVIEEEDPETEHLVTRYEGRKVADATLDDEDRTRLAFLVDVMADFIHHDSYRGTRGLAGTPVHTIDGFNLFGWLKWLTTDWTGASRTSLSSVFVQFLIDNALWTRQEAIVAIAQRKVAAHEDFSWDADERAEAAAAKFSEASVAAAVAGRTDLRELPSWTIDPADAKDHDDAVSYEKTPDGGHVLWVHIADVAHYVEKDGTLDFSAKKRATSVYLPTGVLPMLPKSLSDSLCSLNEGVDRLAMTAKLTFGPDLALAKEEVFESVIRVTGNVSYDDVLTAVEASDDAHGFASLEAFASALDAKRRGLVLETGERRIALTTEDVKHSIKGGNRATKMIEVFMVAANEAVARYLTAAGVALPYRCHPLPDRVAVDRFNKQMETMEQPITIELPKEHAATDDADDDDADAPSGGPSILDQLKSGGTLNLMTGGAVLMGDDADDEADEDVDDEAPATPAVVMNGLAQLTDEEQEAWLAPFRAALKQVLTIKDERVRDLVYIKVLSCMGRAIYTPQNLGHFGLGSACYCHFTSPIRRYADVLVHRQVKAVLNGEEAPHSDDLEDLCLHTTAQSVAADQLERDNVDVAMVFISLNGDWDGTQRAVVNGLTKAGVFLSLPRGLEARLASSDIPGGPWAVDDSDSMLFAGSADRDDMDAQVTADNWRDLYNADLDEVVKVRVRLGDTMDVVVAGRDFVDGKVSLKLAGGDGPGE